MKARLVLCAPVIINFIRHFEGARMAAADSEWVQSFTPCVTLSSLNFQRR